MLDPRFAIWNTLHDGKLTALTREEPDTVMMSITIPYLRKRISPGGDSFCLRLHGVRRIQFAGFGASYTDDYEEIASYSLWILSTDSDLMPVRIATAEGFLVLDFDSLHISLDTGQPISYEQLDRVSEEYWDEFSRARKT
jgi:hypothetical protein